MFLLYKAAIIKTERLVQNGSRQSSAAHLSYQMQSLSKYCTCSGTNPAGHGLAIMNYVVLLIQWRQYLEGFRRMWQSVLSLAASRISDAGPGSLVTNRTRVYASTKTYFLRWKAFWQPSLQALSLADRDCAHYNWREGGGVKQKQRLRYRWGWGVEDGKERGMDKQQPPPRLCYNCVREGGGGDW